MAMLRPSGWGAELSLPWKMLLHSATVTKGMTARWSHGVLRNWFAEEGDQELESHRQNSAESRGSAVSRSHA